MQIKFITLFSFVFILSVTYAQNIDIPEIDTLTTSNKVYENSDIINAEILNPVFEKLYQIKKENKGKVRIVHMGDSHIQADFLTGAARTNLQTTFGNAGLGFLFPHKLIKTNGNYLAQYKSNTWFKSYRVTKPVDNEPVGVSGYSLSTSSSSFAIEVNLPDNKNLAHAVKILTPNNESMFNLGFSSRIISLGGNSKKATVHKIKTGETLSGIASKYNLSISQLKNANNLSTNSIRAGKVLKIPNQVAVDTSLDMSLFSIQNLIKETTAHTFRSNQSFSKFYLLPSGSFNTYTLNGLVIENDSPGITYSGIGVNSARYSDFNKYDLIFEQLQVLEPDVIVVGFGTNESFDKLNQEDYIKAFNKFKENVKKYCPNTVILATTPPPSSLYRKYLNTYAQDYATGLVDLATQEKEIAVWNLFYVFGGLHGVDDNLRQGLMAKDRVHYSKAGYEQQGKLLSDAFIKAYQSFILNK